MTLGCPKTQEIRQSGSGAQVILRRAIERSGRRRKGVRYQPMAPAGSGSGRPRTPTLSKPNALGPPRIPIGTCGSRPEPGPLRPVRGLEVLDDLE